MTDTELAEWDALYADAEQPTDPLQARIPDRQNWAERRFHLRRALRESPQLPEPDFSWIDKYQANKKPGT